MTDTDILDYLQDAIKHGRRRTKNDVEIGDVFFTIDPNATDLRVAMTDAIQADQARRVARVAKKLTTGR